MTKPESHAEPLPGPACSARHRVEVPPELLDEAKCSADMMGRTVWIIYVGDPMVPGVGEFGVTSDEKTARVCPHIAVEPNATISPRDAQNATQ